VRIHLFIGVFSSLLQTKHLIRLICLGHCGWSIKTSTTVMLEATENEWRFLQRLAFFTASVLYNSSYGRLYLCEY